MSSNRFRTLTAAFFLVAVPFLSRACGVNAFGVLTPREETLLQTVLLLLSVVVLFLMYRKIKRVVGMPHILARLLKVFFVLLSLGIVFYALTPLLVTPRCDTTGTVPIRATVSNIVSYSEIYFQEHGTYLGICEDEQVVELLAAAESYATSADTSVCVSGAEQFAVSAQLPLIDRKKGYTYFCGDNTGIRMTVNEPITAPSCNNP